MILIIDLENTCVPREEKPAGYHAQIIEIGAAWVTPEGVCGFHGHPATHSMNIRPLIPR